MWNWDLVCPKCRVGLDAVADALRCRCCQEVYPSIGGVRCLAPSPAAFLQMELGRFAHYRVAVHERAHELLADAARAHSSHHTRARLMHIARGFLNELSCLDDLFAPLLEVAARYPALAAEPARPEDPLAATRYSEHLFRDWVWGEAELRRTLELLAPHLTTPAPKLAVFGAGTARLALDLARQGAVGQVVALDLNPLPFLVADRLLHGAAVDLVEFPLVPRHIEHSAIARHLEPLASPADNLQLMWADAVWSPFADRTLDVVVTPWFIDAADADIAEVTAEIARVLRPGGLWLNVGPLSYSTSPARSYSLEEIFDVAADRGFSIDASEEHHLEYFNSPVSGTCRVDRTYVFAARSAAAANS